MTGEARPIQSHTLVLPQFIAEQMMSDLWFLNIVLWLLPS